jgi:hypothetical protein
MKIEINTSVRTIQRVNMILNAALEQIESRDDLKEFFDVKEKDVKSIKSFRKKLIDSYFKQRDSKEAE